MLLTLGFLLKGSEGLRKVTISSGGVTVSETEFGEARNNWGLVWLSIGYPQ